MSRLHEAIERAGDENAGVWTLEGGKLMRRFTGSYTIDEVKSLLRDMERIQAELYKLAIPWSTTRTALELVSDFLEANYTVKDMPDILPAVRAALAEARS